MNSNSTKMDRRDFIKVCAATYLGVTANGFADAPNKALAENIIYLYMEGGMSHVDSFDPKERKDIMGPYSAVDTIVPGIKLGNRLPELGKLTNKMAIVRSLQVDTGAHEQAQYIARTSYKKIGSIVHPHFGSWLLALREKPAQAIPQDVIISAPSDHSCCGWMDKRFSPLPISDPKKGLQDSLVKDKGLLESRFNILANLEKSRIVGPSSAAYTSYYKQAVTLLQSKEIEIFDISKEPKEIIDAYGEDRFGQGCLLARRLIELGNVKFVEVNVGGWDTHVDNFGQLDKRLPMIDKVISTLINDLEKRGLLQKTLIVIASEFGRTPKINAGNGRDHSPSAFSGVLIGAGVKNGVVYGASDDAGEKVVDKEASVMDFNATIAAAAGLDYNKKLVSPEGRPFTVADKGEPIKDILA